MKRKEFVGRTFGRLTVIARFKHPSLNVFFFKCLCQCGKVANIRANSVTGGITKSCGCFRREKLKTHGQSRSAAHRLWCSIKNRCYNPHASNFQHYGGRGIKMHAEWRDSFEAFFRDVGDPPKGKRIDRKENSGNYEPGNIRFVDAVTQQNNKRNNHVVTFNGQSRTLAEWQRATGIPSSRIRARLRNGWSAERALKQEKNRTKERQV